MGTKPSVGGRGVVEDGLKYVDEGEDDDGGLYEDGYECEDEVEDEEKDMEEGEYDIQIKVQRKMLPTHY